MVAKSQPSLPQESSSVSTESPPDLPVETATPAKADASSSPDAQLEESEHVETKEAAPSLAPALTLAPTKVLDGYVEIESVGTQTGKMKAEEGLATFLTNLREIPQLFDAPEILSAQIRGIMQDLAENPEFLQHIAEEDIGKMVRGMRESLGVAQITKTANKAKRAGTSKKSAMVSEMSEMMKMGGGLAALSELKV